MGKDHGDDDHLVIAVKEARATLKAIIASAHCPRCASVAFTALTIHNLAEVQDTEAIDAISGFISEARIHFKLLDHKKKGY